MAGIVSAMVQQASQFNKDKISSAAGAMLGMRPTTQAQIQAKAMGQGSVGNAAGVSNPAPAGMAAAASSGADTSGLEARIAALEASGSNTPSASSSMDPRAIATGEAMFGNQEQRNNSINPFNSALI
jgi:hypothetical protein